MSATGQTAPPGWVRLDNRGDPALLRVSDIATVYKNGTTNVVLRGIGAVPFTVHVSESVDEVGAAIAAAEA